MIKILKSELNATRQEFKEYVNTTNERFKLLEGKDMSKTFFEKALSLKESKN